MGNQRGTFAKRRREQNLKDKARGKAERLATRRARTGPTKGPEIDWPEPGSIGLNGLPIHLPPSTDASASTDATAPSPDAAAAATDAPAAPSGPAGKTGDD